MAITASPPSMRNAFSGMLTALAEHTAPPAQPGSETPAATAAPDFSDIHLGFAQLKHLLDMPPADWATIRSDFDDVRRTVGLPPSAAPPVSGLLAAATRNDAELLKDMDLVWERFAPPLRPLREVIRESVPFANSPQLKRISGLYGAFRRMGESMRRAAGPAWRAFVADARTQGFLTTVGLHVTQAIAQSAGSLHDTLAATAANNQARTALKALKASATATAEQLSTTNPTRSPLGGGQEATAAPAREPATSPTRATDNRVQAARLRSPAKATPQQQGTGRERPAPVVPSPRQRRGRR